MGDPNKPLNPPKTGEKKDALVMSSTSAVVAGGSSANVASLAKWAALAATPGLGELTAIVETGRALYDVAVNVADGVRNAVNYQNDATALLDGAANDIGIILDNIQRLTQVQVLYKDITRQPASKGEEDDARKSCLAIIEHLVLTVLGPECLELLQDSLDSGLAPGIQRSSELMGLDAIKTLTLLYARLHNSVSLMPYRDLIASYDMAGYTVAVKQLRGTGNLTAKNLFLDIVDTLSHTGGEAYLFDFKHALDCDGDLDLIMAGNKDKGSEGADLATKVWAAIKQATVTMANEFAPNSNIVVQQDIRKKSVTDINQVKDPSPVKDPINFLKTIKLISDY